MTQDPLLSPSELLRARAAGLKVAVVHDWMFVRRGGERTLEQILELVPHADLFYLFGDPAVLKTARRPRAFGSFLASLPGIGKYYKLLLPLLPTAMEAFDLSGYDLVLSSSSCVAKGVVASPLATHVCYVHSPMRYAWDQEHRYFRKAPSLRRPLEILRRHLLSRLRMWDVAASARAHALVANSAFVAARCSFYYGRPAAVAHPPVEVQRFLGCTRTAEGARKILLFGAWVPYKKMREALDACVARGLPVVAAGQGSCLESAARAYAGHPGVECVLSPSESEVERLFARCHVLLFPAIEDFGIVPVEACAAGLWVVAPRQGGTGESVVDGRTGFHFQEGDDDSMFAALTRALASDTTPEALSAMRAHALSFSQESFRDRYASLVLAAMDRNKVMEP